MGTPSLSGACFAVTCLLEDEGTGRSVQAGLENPAGQETALGCASHWRLKPPCHAPSWTLGSRSSHLAAIKPRAPEQKVC